MNKPSIPHLFVCVWYLIQSHPVLLDCLRELPLLEIDISHIDSQSAGIAEHFVPDDNLIRVDGLLVHLVRLVLIGQVEKNLKREIKADEILFGSSLENQSRWWRSRVTQR